MIRMREASSEVARAAVEQGKKTRGIDAHDRGRLVLREAFDGRQQKGLPDTRRQGGEVPVERRRLGGVDEVVADWLRPDAETELIERPTRRKLWMHGNGAEHDEDATED